MGKISVVINTYNAEKYLERVLESVKGFDETVVCDMESTDRTVAIAQAAGCRVVTFAKADHVSAEPARTFAIQSALNKWVLVVDADELVTPELRSYLYRRIEEPGCPEGLYIPRKNMFMGAYEKGFSADYQLRFFIREGTEWPPYVHTFPTVKGRTEKIPMKLHNVRLMHLADETVEQIIDKDNRYSKGEIAKKQGRRYGVGALLLKPLWRFFFVFFVRGGYKDGKAGVIRAGLNAFYKFMFISKIMEKEIRDKNNEANKQ
jgi:glycosyltransferase involved in cell wall biosynthesis